jgi:16S rRNA (guanine527-N7)-methyltransferase
VHDVLDAAGFQRATGCDDAVLARLEAYVAVLNKWQARINLVSRSTLAEVWHRHMLDSAQLAPLIPATARVLVDLGSGPGLPGLVVAALRPDLTVHSVESDGRKMAFQAEAARLMNLGNIVFHVKRAEHISPAPQADVVTARALAALPQLLAWALPFVSPNGHCLFLKGRGVEDELTAARKIWTLQAECIPSRTDAGAAIVKIAGLQRLQQ